LDTSSQRDRTPINLNRSLYSRCFGVVTWYTLRLVQSHLSSISYPLQPCTGVFTRTMGLLCAYICDYKKALGGLTPEDFNSHWYWDNLSVFQPIRDPISIRQRNIQASQIALSGRILSIGI